MTATWRMAGSALVFVLLAAAPTYGVDPDEIQDAIEQGVLFLKHGQHDDGTWIFEHRTGATALIALTLLECDVDPADSAVQRAATAVRNGCEDENQTYGISLAIIFLDRLGENQDNVLIDTLAKRLLLGQNSEGGWGYLCPVRTGPVNLPQVETLRGQNQPPRQGETGAGAPPATPPRSTNPQQGFNLVPARPLGVVAQSAGGDNSNTQFGLLGVWVAARHKLRVHASLSAVGQRFRATQEADGGWSYTGNMVTTPSMTCSGLLGLAVAYGVANQAAANQEPAGNDRKESKRPAKVRAPRDPSRDRSVRAGLLALSNHINGAFADAHRASGLGPPPNFAGIRAPAPPPGPNINDALGGWPPGARLIEDRTDYYFLWSLERVAMTYGLKTIGKKDWYDWGAKILLEHRRPNHGWKGFYDAKIDTSFALLFLRRSNLVSDLSSSLRGKVNDPSEIKLQSGGSSGAELTDRQILEGNRDPNARPKLKKGAETRKTSPTDPEADRRAKQVINASSLRQPGLIEDLRDSKGAVNTAALAAVIPHLTGPVHQKARDALVMRLTRMTANTLQDKLHDDDSELRRAAALAAAMKDVKQVVPDLIDLLGDDEATVSKAARVALREITKQDFGPDANAGEADRAKAASQWKAWWEKNK
jgi:hypothetical protein